MMNPPSSFFAKVRIPYGSLVPTASLLLEPQVALAPLFLTSLFCQGGSNISGVKHIAWTCI